MKQWHKPLVRGCRGWQGTHTLSTMGHAGLVGVIEWWFLPQGQGIKVGGECPLSPLPNNQRVQGV
jgi:hypothetical protein